MGFSGRPRPSRSRGHRLARAARRRPRPRLAAADLAGWLQAAMQRPPQTDQVVRSSARMSEAGEGLRMSVVERTGCSGSAHPQAFRVVLTSMVATMARRRLSTTTTMTVAPIWARLRGRIPVWSAAGRPAGHRFWGSNDRRRRSNVPTSWEGPWPCPAGSRACGYEVKATSRSSWEDHRGSSPKALLPDPTRCRNRGPAGDLGARDLEGSDIYTTMSIDFNMFLRSGGGSGRSAIRPRGLHGQADVNRGTNQVIQPRRNSGNHGRSK